MLTQDEQLYLAHCPSAGQPFYGQDINNRMRLTGWNATTHRGWATWRIKQSLVTKGYLQPLVSGPGRRNILVRIR